MSRIQDDLEHCAPPDRHVATQIAICGHRFNIYSEGKCAQHMLRAGDSDKSDSQDESDSGRPRTLRTPRSPRGHPDRHVATDLTFIQKESARNTCCAQEIQ